MKNILKYILLVISVFYVSISNSQTWNTTFNNIDSLWAAGGAQVYAFHNEKDSILYMGGAFQTVNTTYVNGIFSWDGTNWYSFGDGITQASGTAECIEIYNNKLFMGGGVGGW